MAVVAIGQVDADFLGSLHLELVHCLPGLGDVELIVIVAHNGSLLLSFSPEIPTVFRRKRLPFRTPIMPRFDTSMNGDWRKGWGIPPLDQWAYIIYSDGVATYI